ncbi:MAG: 50S ribosomal protein L13 [Alphaproteobacteria bacterium CG_4_10_14_0_8_um_filter_53_9]|nr:MAG: 50S ribosomal protein L13 [Alphaproteobacteria bacterium CG_4_10_14_0_8_um_filter_53_9]
MNITRSLKPADAKPDWYVVDATGIPLGRLSTQIAMRLRGKHKPSFTAHADAGDNIIVINAEKVGLTGYKAQNSKFFYHTGFIGGIKEILMGDELKGKHPERVIERAVKRMLPKESALARKQFKKLHVYAGETHPHEAQQPKVWNGNVKEGK